MDARLEFECSIIQRLMKAEEDAGARCAPVDSVDLIHACGLVEADPRSELVDAWTEAVEGLILDGTIKYHAGSYALTTYAIP